MADRPPRGEGVGEKLLQHHCSVNLNANRVGVAGSGVVCQEKIHPDPVAVNPIVYTHAYSLMHSEKQQGYDSVQVQF